MTTFLGFEYPLGVMIERLEFFNLEPSKGFKDSRGQGVK
jgi:hypothetical protein